MMVKRIKRAGGASTQRLYLAVGLLLFAVMGCAQSHKIVCFWPSNHTAAEMAGTFLGFSHMGTDNWRIELREKGGFIAWADWTNAPEIYRIDSWQVRGGEMLINSSPISTDAPPLKIIGMVAGRNAITFDIAEPGTGWSRSVLFYRESELEGSILKLKQAMENLK